MYDITIIGAGPVGSYLANKLSKTGLKVLVVDKKTNAGIDTYCTGIISPECLSLLGPLNDIKRREINSLKLIDPSGKSLYFQRKEKFAYVIDRPSLNELLVSAAEQNGATYLFSTTITDIVVNDNKILSHTYTGSSGAITIESGMVVIATGYGSRLPEKVGLGKISSFVCAAQAKVCMDSEAILEIYADRKLAAGGFAWLVPTWNGTGLAGLLCTNHPKLYMDRFINALKSQRKIEQNDYSHWCGLIPVTALKKTYSDRILVVGEAAGQVKPITGGGIFYGIISADIAADVIQKAFAVGDFSDNFLSIYQRRWHDILLKEISFGYRLRSVWSKLNNSAISLLFNTASALKLPQSINSTNKLYFDWHRKTLLGILSSHLSFTNHK